MKYNFFYLLLLFNVVLFSCGDDEPECVIPTSSFSITIDGETISGGESFGDISNTTLSGFEVRYIDLYFTFSDGRTFTIGVQNIDTDLGGVCVDNRSYDFEAAVADCFDLGQNTTICNESDIEYIDGQGSRFSDFIQIGSVTIIECNLEKNTISGAFSGTIINNFAVNIEVSGTFTDILVEE